MVHKFLVWAICGAALGGVGAAGATPDESTPGTTAPAAATPKNDLSQRAGTLSDKLSDANGVIHREGVIDPKMQKKPPAVGAMPVIPPPGSPGGSTAAQAK
jgi:hypothetical protein